MKDPCREDLLRDAFSALEKAGHKVCVMHAYESLPLDFWDRRDVDIVSEDPEAVPRILLESHVASVVQVLEGAQADTCYVLHRKAHGRHVLLKLDVAKDSRRFGVVFASREEILGASRRHEFFEVPSPAVEFGCYLARRLVKGLDPERCARLSSLYAQDPEGGRAQLTRLFRHPDAAVVDDAARTGDWSGVVPEARRLRAALIRNMSRGHRGARTRYLLSRVRARARAFARPQGLMVGFIGTDGSGKTTVSLRVEEELAPAFMSTKRLYRRTLSSPRRWLNKRYQYPHEEVGHSYPPPALERPPFGPVGSLLKLGFWWFDFTVLGYLLEFRRLLAKGYLITVDRFFEDLLVFPAYYRYGGPMWLARLTGRLMPHPDLVFLLDAPPEVIQARKRDLTPEETARQRREYLQVVKDLPHVHIVDSSRPVDEVVGEVEEIILRHMAARAAKGLAADAASAVRQGTSG